MREIKFRQPIFVKGRFYNWHYWGFLGEGHFAGPEINSSTIKRAMERSQQLTGMRDKNGAEIYEGDIVRWYVNDVTREGIVDYISESACFDLKNFHDQYHVCNDWYRGEYEVLGNIFQHPELMEPQ